MKVKGQPELDALIREPAREGWRYGGIATCGAASGIMTIIGLIEGIVYPTKSDEDFMRLYVQGHTGWF